jgi:hypothetical protein
MPLARTDEPHKEVVERAGTVPLMNVKSNVLLSEAENTRSYKSTWTQNIPTKKRRRGYSSHDLQSEII